MASWLKHSSPDRVVRVRVLTGDSELCSWARPLSTQVLACVAGGILCTSAFVLVARLQGDWQGLELNSHLPNSCFFFQLCNHQCTRISDWLRVGKRQSNVNQYLSPIPRENICVYVQICKIQNVECSIEKALVSPNI